MKAQKREQLTQNDCRRKRVNYQSSARVAKKKPLAKNDRLSIAQACISENIRANLILKVSQISRSFYDYKPLIEGKKVGKLTSSCTKKLTGGYDNDSLVIEEIIKILALPFVDYGYLKTTFYLRDEKNYLINTKKVYRLMAENGLLCDTKGIREHSSGQWVKELVPNLMDAFTYFEFDIKYIHIHGKRRSAQVLTVLDVFSRWNMEHLIKWDMKQNGVINLFHQIFENYDLPSQFFVRNDSQQTLFNNISKIKMLPKNLPNQPLLSKMLGDFCDIKKILKLYFFI